MSSPPRSVAIAIPARVASDTAAASDRAVALGSTPDWTAWNDFRSPHLSTPPRDSSPASPMSNGYSFPLLNTDEFFEPLFSGNDRARVAAIESVVGTLESIEEHESEVFRGYIPSLVRLAHESPLEDIRSAFQEFLARVGLASLTPPPVSAFLKPKILPSVGTSDARLSSFFQDVFLSFGRVLNVFRVLAVLPSFVTHFYSTYKQVMNGDGALAEEWRAYVAFIGAQSVNCDYLMRWQAAQQIRVQSDEFFAEPDSVPEEMERLRSFARLLAVEPWSVSVEHIRALFNAGWSSSGLVHASIILIMFQSLSGFVQSLGVLPDSDISDDTVESASSDSDEELAAENTRVIAEMVDSEPAEDHTQMWVDEYNWSEHALPFLYHVFGKIAPLLDRELSVAQSITDRRFHSVENVDTTAFRRAIWQYVFARCGVRDDDVAAVSPLLNKSLVALIDHMLFSPATLTLSDFNSVGLNLRQGERVHVAMLVMEARKQAALMFVLRAVAQEMRM